MNCAFVLKGFFELFFVTSSSDFAHILAILFSLPIPVFEDVPLFSGLINDLFPGMDCPRVGYEDLKAAAAFDLDSRGNRCSNEKVFSELTDKVSTTCCFNDHKEILAFCFDLNNT